MPRNLRAVGAGEVAERKEHTVMSAAADGDRLDLLIAMRTRLATAVESPKCPPRDLAALTRRLLEVAAEIEILEAAERKGAERGTAGDEAFDASAV